MTGGVIILRRFVVVGDGDEIGMGIRNNWDLSMNFGWRES